MLINKRLNYAMHSKCEQFGIQNYYLILRTYSSIKRHQLGEISSSLLNISRHQTYRLTVPCHYNNWLENDFYINTCAGYWK